MAWSFLHTNSAISGYTAKTIPLTATNYADFVQTSKSENEAWVASKTSPRAFMDRIRYSLQRVANMYRNSGIDTSVQSSVKTGKRFLVQSLFYLSQADATSPLGYRYVPLRFHTVVEASDDPNLTADNILSGLQIHVSHMMGQNDVTSARLDEMLRGMLVPTQVIK